ncbi:MAG: PAS domain S-box protein [Bacteroidetes bacterium]|nr:PAS domain S-box protein [Bacteroidota bacterium]MBL6943077.1 PAS domain S-box protein [Bacteroidales bacterium]
MIDNIAYGQILILLLQCLIVAILLLSLFRLRTIFGLGLLFAALGVFQYMQVFLSSSLYIEIMPGVLVSPGSMVLFTGSLFAILIVYIREDALEARKVIYALLAANLALTLLQVVFGWAIEGEGVKNIYDLPKEFFTQNARILIVGTLILFIDAFIIIIIYEKISRYVSSLLLKILLSMVLVVSIDSLFFSFGAFAGTDQFQSVLVTGLFSKISATLIYSGLFTFYLLYLDKDIIKKDFSTGSYKDIFYSLTFRQKYDEVFKEKETQKVVLQKSEEYNRLLFNTSPIGLALCKMDGSFVDINPAYAKIIGRTIEETLKLNYQDITPEKYSAQEAFQIKSLEETGRYGPYEKEYIYKDNHLVPVVISGLIIERDGEKFIWSIAEDITERKRSEEALMSEKEFSEKIFETSNAIIIGLDKNHFIKLFNKGAENITGYTKAEMIGKDWFEFFFPNELLSEMDQVWKDAWGTSSHSYINQILTKTGEGRMISWQSSGFYEDTDSDKHLLISIGEDITERKQAEEQITRFSRIFEDTLNEICLFDAATLKFTQVNSAAQQNLGYTTEELQKMTPLNIKPEFTLESFEKLITPLRNGEKEKIIFETVHKRKDQSLYDVEVHLQLLKDEKKDLLVAIILDISERKKAEKILLEREAYSKALFDYAAVPIWVEDFSEVKKYFNKLKEKGVNDFSVYFHENIDEVKHIASLVKVSEINQKNLEFWVTTSKEELLLTLPNWFNEESWPVFRDEQIALAEGKSQFESEISIVSPQGDKRQLILYLAVHPDHLDTLKIVFVSFIDITDRKNVEEELEKHRNHLEEIVKKRTESLAKSQNALLNLVDDMNNQSVKLEKSNQQLVAINDELEAFTYSVSHDLKAPLRGIDGYSQLLLESYYEELNQEARGFLENIRKSTQQMNLLIEDLLAYSRMERQAYQIEKVNFKALIDNLLLYFSKTIGTKNVEFKFTFPDTFMPSADKDGMNLVMRNLLDNAIKFTSPHRSAQIEIGGSESDNNWLIFVKDNGIGFDMKYHDRIYKIFQRLHLAEEYEGTGIGLAMVSKAMHRMNGKIWAESEVGKGASFYLEIKKT